MKCKYCNAELDKDALFCTKCGKDLSAFDRCKKCDEFLEKGALFCTNCGTEQTHEEEGSCIINREEKRQEDKRSNNRTKIIIGIIALLLIAGGGYYYYQKKQTEERMLSEERAQSEKKEAERINAINERVTPDLAFFELHGPVKELCVYDDDNNSIRYNFSKEGKLTTVNGRNNFIVKNEEDANNRMFYSTSNTNGPYYLYNNHEQIVRRWFRQSEYENYYDEDVTWKQGMLNMIIREYLGGGEADCYKDTYYYDEKGNCTKMIRTEFITDNDLYETYDMEDDRTERQKNIVTPSELKFEYSYKERDEKGNWLSRRAVCKNPSAGIWEYYQRPISEKRTITYYEDEKIEQLSDRKKIILMVGTLCMEMCLGIQ